MKKKLNPKRIKPVAPTKQFAALKQESPSPQDVSRLETFYVEGRYAEAAALAQTLTVRFPLHGFGWKALGAALQRLGRREDALEPKRKAAALSPQDADAHYNLGNAFKELGLLDEAVASYRQALKIKPDFLLTQSNLGNTLQELGRLEEAEASYRRALQIKPDFVEALNNLGNTLQDLGRLKEAEASYLRTLQIKPDYAEAHNNLGNTLHKLGRLSEAEASYHQALQIKPDYAAVHCNLGNTLQDLGRLNEAEASCRCALQIKPDYVEVLNNLGGILHDLGRLDEAETSCRRALAIKSNYAKAHINLGNILQETGRLDEAEASCRRALENKPNFAEAHDNLLFALNYHPDKSGEEIFAAYQEYDKQFGLPCRTQWLPHNNNRDTHRRLKVGYVSPDFRQHSCRHFLEPLLAHHDKTVVEIYAYAELLRPDAVTARYQTYVDHWVITAGMTDDALSERIRADGIDILVDLAGHTAKNRLPVFARKPAPVSVSWLGYGYTTGLTAIDYYLTDETNVPRGSEGLFSEIPWRLQTPGFAYRPAEGMGAVSPLPALTRHYVTFGTLTRGVRINHRTIRVWSEILKRVPGARLVINSKDFQTLPMQDALARKFAAHGISRERLEIGCHSPPWDVLRGLDIGLDCFPHNSGTTLFESLYMGVPFVTLAGRPSVGRLGSSILDGGEHPQWIAHTEDEYVEIAAALASDLSKLAELRGNLRHEMQTSALMDEAGFVRKVETAYRDMWIKWAAKQGVQNEVRPETAQESQQQLRSVEVEAPAEYLEPSPQEIRSLETFYLDGRYAEAAELAQTLTVRFPLDGFGWKALGAALQRLGRSEDALEPKRRAAVLSPQDADAHYNLGNALKELGLLDDAVASYRHALLIKPDFPLAQSNLGNTLQELGRLEEAEASYRRALQLKPDYVEVHSNLGTALKKLGRLDEAEASYVRALQLKPDYALIHYYRANTLIELGRLAEAESSYQRALQIRPDYVEVLNNLGNVFLETGRLDEAAGSYERALQIKPDYAEAHNNLSNTLQKLGRLNEAEASGRRALQLNPDYVEALNNLGNTLQDLGRLEEAEASYRRALQIKPDYASAYNNLGNTLQKLGQVSEAETNCRRALEIKPDFAEAHNNLGNALQKLGRLSEAEASYRRALQIKLDYAESLSNLGTTLQDLGRLNEAEANSRRALQIKPDYAESLSNLGHILQKQGRLDEAEAMYRRALQIKPDYAEVQSNLGNVLQETGRLDEAEASCRRALENKPNFAEAHDNLLFALNYHPDKSGEEIFAAYQEYDKQFGLPCRTQWLPHNNNRDTHRRLKVGYVSPDFRQHSCRHFLEPLLAHHDKTVVEIYAYAELLRPDAVTARYQTYVDHWVITAGMTDDALSERIRADGIDILVDLAGHTAKNRLPVFARKPAPVSVSWLGYGYTTGLTAIDYYLTDETNVPRGSEGLFSEIPWRLQTPGFAYRPAEGMGAVSPLPALTRHYVTFGTLTRGVRINHRTIRVWSEILKRVPGARLVINSKDFQTLPMQDALARKFAAHGISRERLEIGCHSPPWDVLRGLDIGLDCFPHNSGTTLFESLYMGVPFVTLAGRPSVGRLGSSILDGGEHPQWIAHTEDEYVEIAAALASDLSKLAELRGNLRHEMQTSALMDEAGFVRKVETAYRDMFEKWSKKK